MRIRKLRFRCLFCTMVVAVVQHSYCNAGQSDCSRPARGAAAPAEDEESTTAAASNAGGYAAAPVMFAAPAATGEISGARSGLCLPGLRLTLPKISFETPELNLLGFSRSRRDPHMNIDASAAPASYQNPLLFGQIPATGQAAQFQPTRAANAAPAEVAPATQEGCTSLESRQQIEYLAHQVAELQALLAQQDPAQRKPNSSQNTKVTETDPWRNSKSSELRQTEQQVKELATQITELQSVVVQLAELQTARVSAANEQQAVQQTSQRVSPWEQTQPTISREEHEAILLEQSERISMLEARLTQLSASHTPEVQQSSKPAEPDRVPQIPLERASKPIPQPKRGVFERVGIALSRR